MSKKLGVKIPLGGISPNFVKNLPVAFLLEDRFLLDLGKIYSLLELMKLAPGKSPRITGSLNKKKEFGCRGTQSRMFWFYAYSSPDAALAPQGPWKVREKP